MKLPKVPGWAIATGLVVLAVGGAWGGSAYRQSIVDIQTATVASVDEAIAASESATQAVEDARAASELASTAATSKLADEQAAAASEAARVAEEARVAAEAAAAEAGKKAAVDVPTKKPTTGDAGATGPVRCPAGSQANSNDGTNDTSCFPVICFGITVPDPAHPECDVAFKP